MTDASDWRNMVQDEVVSGQRARKRDSLFLLARLTFRDSGRELDVRVRNLSEGGLMAEGTDPLEIGLAVTVELRGVGAVPGKVAWYTDGRAGIAFDQVIDPRKARKPVGVRRSA